MDQKRQLIGKRLRTARMLAGLKQGYVGEALKVSQRTISSWEVGRSMPEGDVIMDLCELYGVAPNYILLAQPNPTAQRFDFCPPEGRVQCKILGPRLQAA